MFTNSTGPYGYRAIKVSAIEWTAWVADMIAFVKDGTYRTSHNESGVPFYTVHGR